jgi:phospholipid transport system substrate-binding protein
MIIRALLASAALAFTALSASAGQEAEALIAGTASQISDPERGEEAFRQSIDVPSVARFTLGKHAKRISDEDHQRFAAAFETFLSSTFDEHRREFANAKVEVVGSIDRSPTDSIVETRVTPNSGEGMTVRWRVLERGGQWRVVDVEVLGLWLAIEQRAQIAAIMDKPRATIDDVIAALES